MREQQISSQALQHIGDRQLARLPGLIQKAAAERARLLRDIERLRSRQAVLERKAERASGAKQESLQEEVMQIEMLIHEMEEHEVWLRIRATLPENEPASFDRLTKAFEQLMRCERIWDVTAEQPGSHYRSLATHAVSRAPVRLGFSSVAVLPSTSRPLHFQNANGSDLYIYPGLLVLSGGSGKHAFVQLKDLSIRSRFSRFQEIERVPSDTRTVGNTWRYTNKDGSPDKRFRDNYQVPVVLYGELDFTSASGINERYQVSNPEAAEAFCTALQDHCRQAAAVDLEPYLAIEDPDETTARRRQSIQEAVKASPVLRRTRGPAAAAVTAAVLLVVLLGAYALQSRLLSFADSVEELVTPFDHLTAVNVEPNQVVGETGRFSLTVVARRDKLSPIRVMVDGDVRRPFWVELGEAIQFNWNERVIVEGDLASAQLVLNGYALEHEAVTPERVELNAALASKYLGLGETPRTTAPAALMRRPMEAAPVTAPPADAAAAPPSATRPAPAPVLPPVVVPAPTVAAPAPRAQAVTAPARRVSTATRSTTPTRRVSAVQCSGTTKKGARCKRRTTNASGRCYQH